MKFFLSILLIFSLQILSEKEPSAPIFLKYENYSNKSICLPNSLISLIDSLKEKVNKNNIEINFNTNLFNNKIKLLENTSNFLFEQDVINGWVNQKEDNNLGIVLNRKQYIKDAKEGTKTYYIGLLKINSLFESYLFLCENKYDEGITESKSFFLINVKNRHVKSITEIASEFVDNGVVLKTYTKKCENNLYILTDDVIGSDVIGTIKEKTAPLNSFFSFDDDGFVIIKKSNKRGLSCN